MFIKDLRLIKDLKRLIKYLKSFRNPFHIHCNTLLPCDGRRSGDGTVSRDGWIVLNTAQRVGWVKVVVMNRWRSLLGRI